MTQSKAPAWLDTVGKAYWRRFAPLLPLTDDSSKEQLAMLCDNWSVFREATKRLQADGLTVQSITGGDKPHPCLAAKWTAQAEIRRLSKTLGLDAVEVDVEEDELDEVLG